MATTNLLRPAEAERIHSAISTEETTETISQAASERSVIVAAGSDSFNLVASVGFKTHLLRLPRHSTLNRYGFPINCKVFLAPELFE
jgi:hypothetical protein